VEAQKLDSWNWRKEYKSPLNMAFYSTKKITIFVPLHHSKNSEHFWHL